MSRATIHERAPLAAALDAGVVTAFVAIGRRNHDEDPGVLGLLSTTAPFLVGLLVAWVVTKSFVDDPTSLRRGLVVWPITVAVGMVLRQLTDQGTALSFVIVAAVFLGVTLLGWRGVYAAVVDRRAAA